MVNISTTITKKDLLDSLVARTSKEQVQKFQNATVAICGLGGLGSNIAISLARAGVGNLILIDFDKVDISNLNRQQYKLCQVGMYKTDALSTNLAEITNLCNIKTYTVKLQEDNYLQYLNSADIVCEAFDNAEEKSKLVNFVLENLRNTFVVSASGMANLDSPNKIVTKKITNRFYLSGDGENSTDDGGSLYAPRVMLCASHQATTILNIIAEN